MIFLLAVPAFACTEVYIGADISEDGTVIMVVPDREPTAGTWALEGDKITVTTDDEAAEGVVSEGAISLSEKGMEMIFPREVVEAIALADVKAAETAEAFYGDWTSVYVETNGVVMGISAVGMGVPSVSISETEMKFYDEADGTLALILKLNKLDAPVFEEGKLTVKAAADALNPNFNLSAELLEDGMLKLTMISSNSPMILYFMPA